VIHTAMESRQCFYESFQNCESAKVIRTNTNDEVVFEAKTKDCSLSLKIMNDMFPEESGEFTCNGLLYYQRFNDDPNYYLSFEECSRE
jgi:hypothetical protein